MRAFLRYLRDLILSCMEDFSEDHSPVSVSSCGVVYFDVGEGGRSAEANPAGWNADQVALGDLPAPVPKG